MFEIIYKRLHGVYFDRTCQFSCKVFITSDEMNQTKRSIKPHKVF